MSSLYTEFQEPTSPSTLSTEPISLLPLKPQTIDEEAFLPREPRPLESYIAAETGEAASEEAPQLKTFRVKFKEFGSFIGPWLPPETLKLLQKSKTQQLSEQEVVKLMDMVAERSIDHFQLPKGKFVAITFSGQIAELADTKIELLKRVQGGRYSEQIFLWKVGSDSFSGRI